MTDTEQGPALAWPDKIDPSIAAAIVKAQHGVGSVRKASEASLGQDRGYKYASAEDMMQAAGAALEANGLALVQLGWHVTRGDTYQVTDRWKNVHRRTDCDVTGRWMLIHESGATAGPFVARMAAVEDNSRALDKAINTALTYLQSYLLRGILNIPRVTKDADGEQRNDTERHGVDPAEAAFRVNADAMREGLAKVQAAAMMQITQAEAWDQSQSKPVRHRVWAETIAQCLDGEVMEGGKPNRDQAKRAAAWLEGAHDDPEKLGPIIAAGLAAIAVRDADEVSDPT